MDWNAQGFDAHRWRVLCGYTILTVMPILLSGCSLGWVPQQNMTSSPGFSTSLSETSDGVTDDFTPGVSKGLPMENFLPEREKQEKIRLGLTAAESKALGCSIRDRFDRGAALAYNFKDEQTRLALHLNIEGPSFSDPGRLEVHKVMIRFTHKFQKPSKTEKKKCLYPSGFQGLAGSIYNEFFLRENYTIWHELRDKGLDFR